MPRSAHMQGNMLLKLLLCIFVSASFAAAWPSLRGTGRQGLQKLQGEEDASWRAMFNDFDRNHDGRLGPGEIVRTGHTLGRRSAAKLMDMVAEDGSIDCYNGSQFPGQDKAAIAEICGVE